MERARARLGATASRQRADRGTARIHGLAEAKLAELLNGRERPRMTDVFTELQRYCQERRVPCPSRSSVYNALGRVPVREFEVASLPEEVRAALYNFGDGDGDGNPRTLPGDQLAFYCFNYGGPRALSFAAGLPWLCLARAAERRGFRPKSRALLEAVMRVRSI